MSARTLYLLSYRSQDRERAHFAIFVPYATGKDGTLIHVVGAPMAGYALQFKRQYNPEMSQTRYQIFPIGQINSQFIHDWAGERGSDGTPRGNLEQVAAQIPPPRVSENFLAPVNNTTNRRCQEWTMDFVRRLVEINYVDSSAADIVQSKRDPPTHGIFSLQGGLGAAREPQRAQEEQAAVAPAPAPAPPLQQQQAPQQQQASSGAWVWDNQHKRHRRWDGTKWVWQE